MGEIRGGVMESFGRLMHEIRSCVRGSFTRCRTEAGLADYIRSLAPDVEAAADEIG